jgi:hypothetical protein
MRNTGVDLSAGGLAMDTLLTFWELDEGFNVVHRREHVIGAYCMLHDTMVTENYYIVWQVGGRRGGGGAACPVALWQPPGGMRNPPAGRGAQTPCCM